MAASLPLAIRKDIRDEWDSPKSSLQASISALTSVLGFVVKPDVQWVALWDALQDKVDKGDFVPLIAGYAKTWYDRLAWRLENEEDWAEQLLNAIPNSQPSLNIDISGAARPSTRWVEKAQAFYLDVPNEQQLSNGQVSAGFDEDFEFLLTEKPPSSVGPPVTVNETKAVRRATPSAQRVLAPQQLSDFHVEGPATVVLPTVHKLDRPSELFTRTGPYILTVETGNPLYIHGSHQPSLEVLANYLKKWGNPSKNVPGVNILSVDLIESEHAAGVVDTVRIEPSSRFGRPPVDVDPTLVLAFIEGVLQYDLVNISANRFLYRSKKTFKLF
ncbi:hypothetical protein BKA70DRAFT_1415958 [Coprinopsis sp. MPI-PUGE-AT-0042]|nr:hypothetical protein BKA70DRAFT_1415958 [Coprinopsis sp. MPI-PUGE-AT-0042]